MPRPPEERKPWELHANNPSRREFFRWVAASILSPAACSLAGGAIAALGGRRAQAASPDLRKDWLARWEKNILQDARNRYCDREMGEEIGWLVSPFLNGFYYGYLATHDGKWVDLLVDWTDAWISRGVKEPDGYIGWPKADGASTSVMPGLLHRQHAGRGDGAAARGPDGRHDLEDAGAQGEVRPQGERAISAWPKRSSTSGTGGAAGAR